MFGREKKIPDLYSILTSDGIFLPGEVFFFRGFFFCVPPLLGAKAVFFFSQVLAEREREEEHTLRKNGGNLYKMVSEIVFAHHDCLKILGGIFLEEFLVMLKTPPKLYQNSTKKKKIRPNQMVYIVRGHFSFLFWFRQIGLPEDRFCLTFLPWSSLYLRKMQGGRCKFIFSAKG